MSSQPATTHTRARAHARARAPTQKYARTPPCAHERARPRARTNACDYAHARARARALARRPGDPKCVLAQLHGLCSASAATASPPPATHVKCLLCDKQYKHAGMALNRMPGHLGEHVSRLAAQLEVDPEIRAAKITGLPSGEENVMSLTCSAPCSVEEYRRLPVCDYLVATVVPFLREAMQQLIDSP